MENDLSTSKGTLKDLLNSEYYLTKVLRQLLEEDDIYECRLVCRRWYDVCSRLPVKLVDVPVWTLPVVVDRFPNAVAVSLHRCIHWNDETTGAIQSLARLRSLKAIELHEVFITGLNNDDVFPFCNLLGEALHECHQLHSLSIKTFCNVEAVLCLYSHLSHLTGLTCLHLPGGWEKLVNDPYTDVRSIEDLAIDSVCLEDGQLVFPSLTHLTRLSIRVDVEPAKKFKGGALQMILPYASSLQLLEISCLNVEYVISKREWECLGEFRQLSSLLFEFLELDFDASQDFCAVLSCLNLTHLCFNGCNLSESFVEKLASVTSLTNLRSFMCESFADNLHNIFPAMPQLTSLCMGILGDIESLTVLTALKTLKFVLAQPVSDLSHVFSCMPNLESLNMYSRGQDFQSSWLSHLKELRSLCLKGYWLDEDIFPTLAQLSGLTELTLRYYHLQSSQWPGINALTNLERLELWNDARADDQTNALMEGKLLRLRYLSLPLGNDDESDQWRGLHQRLPSLIQCFIRSQVYGHVIYPKGFGDTAF